VNVSGLGKCCNPMKKLVLEISTLHNTEYSTVTARDRPEEKNGVTNFPNFQHREFLFPANS